MTGKASIFSPSKEPIFEGQLVRNPTRVQQQGGDGGGVGEFPFQWSWPGLVNYTAAGEGIVTIAGSVINYAYYTLISPPTGGAISVAVFYNGVQETTFSISGTGSTFLEATAAAPGTVIGIAITGVGTGDASGLWIGITPLIP